jgi:KDO2-lipid IV(A) lauroyltransferase
VSLPLKARYLLEYVIGRGLLFLLAAAPLPLVLALARPVAWLCFVLMSGRRQVAIDNLLAAGLCPDERAARRLARASFQSFIVTVLESLVARRRVTAENWRQFLTLRLPPEAEQWMQDPKQGVIVASAHLGNWEAAARAVSFLKPVCAIYRPLDNPWLEREVHARRSGDHLRLIAKSDGDPMRLMKSLAAGEILAIMADQHAGTGGVQVQYFGRPAWTTRSVALLHLLTRAPLLVAVAVRTGPLRYTIETAGPIHFPRTGDRERDVHDLTQQLTLEIEKLVRRHPEQYLWMHRRWR